MSLENFELKSVDELIECIQSSAANVVAIALPTCKNSSYLRSGPNAPFQIAGELLRDEGNPFAENTVDISSPDVFEFLGGIALESDDEFDRIRNISAAAFRAGKRPLFIGGDHSVTYPIVAGLSDVIGPVSILHFDAHPDLYDNFQNNPHSHASPFARILENRLAGSLWQYGIRTLTPHQRDQVQRFGVRCNEMRDHKKWETPALVGPVYVTVDLDALDPAYAPGVAHQEPGGMSVRDILDILGTCPGEVVGCDVVEYHPNRDVNGITAVVAAKLIRELAGRMELDHRGLHG
jgi:agmatinase